MDTKAIHLSGGNYFSDVRLDIQKSIEKQESILAHRKQGPRRPAFRKSFLRNYGFLLFYLVTRKLGIYEFLINNGFVKYWYREFHDYWVSSINGRPIQLLDYHLLRFHYRVQNQLHKDLDWSSEGAHLQNWQKPINLSLTFQHIYKYALSPFRTRYAFGLFKKNTKALEFGCAVAPMYRTWRTFFNHRPISWVLADIPNFPFHFARHAYSDDPNVRFVVIQEGNFNDPLTGVDEKYDLIVLQETFEHLHSPFTIANYLLDRLNPGGLFFFDYFLSEGLGLDTVQGISERKKTLELLAEKLEMIHGDFHISDRSLGTCVGRKKG